LGFYVRYGVGATAEEIGARFDSGRIASLLGHREHTLRQGHRARYISTGQLDQPHRVQRDILPALVARRAVNGALSGVPRSNVRNVSRPTGSIDRWGLGLDGQWPQSSVGRLVVMIVEAALGGSVTL